METQPTTSFFNAEKTNSYKIERTSNLVYTAFTKHELLRNNIFCRVVPLSNTILQKYTDSAQSHVNMKRKMTQHFHRKFIDQADWPQFVHYDA